MKKTLFTLFLTVIMIFAFSITCLAAPSPSGKVKPTKNQQTTNGNGNGNGGSGGNGKPNNSVVSPSTGSYELGGSLMVSFAALGIAIISIKKFSECK